MGTAAFELEIALARRDGGGDAASYGVELRFNDPASQAETGRVFGAQAIRFDPVELRSRSLDPAAYGAYLAAQLLAEPAVRTGFDKATAAAELANAALHLRLAIHPNAAELHALRWETLRLTPAAPPLLAGQNVTFSRYLSSLDWRPVRLRPEAELRALVAVADPADVARYRLAPVDPAAELAAARAGLGDIAITELATRGQVTLTNLAAHLRDGYDILYLVAHGRLIDGEPWLFLEGEDGNVARIAGRDLAARIQELADRPRLAVLVSCRSAGTGAAAPAGDAAPLAALGPRLAEAGVPAVLAMQGDITMATAAAFMPAFFRELRRDGLADRAMAVARGTVRDRPDWWMPVLFSRLKSGRIWGSADDPLFGLSPLPPLDLPDKPYRYLDWYRREDAWVFFGRNREVRALHDRVTAPDGPPVVLFYGQSGVGKSSLLAAGLRPRLEDSHNIRYARRDQALGLLGTLAAALGTAPEADLTGAWHKVEAAAGRPLLVILDQVEELFTRPKEQRPDEMAVFLAALASLFGDPGRRPRGKLILSFRKEWLAEIKERLAEHALPRSEVFLERLDREGIIEVVTGPGRTQRLRAQYGLTISDPLLPGLIADDLLADRESPVAPMLAILLAGMWEAATARSYDRPAFDTELYHEFRSRGLKLDDFLNRQLQALHGKQPEVVDSGLALDLLAYHTTPLGTAEQRTLADLEQTYRHRQDMLPALVQECRDLYLLVDPSQNRPGQPRASRLTHDTLAPHVRKRFDESDAPGQRARRILESRAVDWADGKEGAPLDETDLTLVEAGESGMRSKKPGEERLVRASAAARVRRMEEQRQQELALETQRTKAANRLRLLIAILTVLAMIAPGLWLRQQILKWQAASPLIEVPATQLTLESSTTPIAVPRYYMEKYEVSNKQYSLCVQANACEVPVDPKAYQDANFANHPVVYVTAYQADNYCRWLGRRLPTSLEWLRVTRGPNGSSWPWGQEPIDPSRVNMSFINSPSAGTAPADSYPEGRSGIPEGIHNLIGNVWEWTATPLKQDPYSANPEWKEAIIKRTIVGLIVLGGAYRSDAAAEDWTTMQNPSPPSRAEPWLGFRCAQ